MNPREWFILALRTIGIYELIVTIDYGVTAFNYTAGLYRPDRTQVGGVVTHLLATFVIAGWLLKAAPSIASFFYPPSPPLPPRSTYSDEPLIPPEPNAAEPHN